MIFYTRITKKGVTTMDRFLVYIILLFSIPFSILICFEEYASSLVCFAAAYIVIGYYQNNERIVKFINKYL